MRNGAEIRTRRGGMPDAARVSIPPAASRSAVQKNAGRREVPAAASGNKKGGFLKESPSLSNLG